MERVKTTKCSGADRSNLSAVWIDVIESVRGDGSRRITCPKLDPEKYCTANLLGEKLRCIKIPNSRNNP